MKGFVNLFFKKHSDGMFQCYFIDLKNAAFKSHAIRMHLSNMFHAYDN